MTIPSRYRWRSVYHFLTIKNLQSVLQHGLLAKHELKRRNISYRSIAYDTIQLRRSNMPVPCGPGGVVHDYVPFYFCRRSPMLHAVVKQGFAEQHNIIYLRFPIKIMERYRWVFTNASANTKVTPQFFDQLDDLDAIDWKAVEKRRWKSEYDTPGQIPVRQAKQAELLVHQFVDLSEIAEIVVWNEDVKQQVCHMYTQTKLPIPTISFGGSQYYFQNDDGTSSIRANPANELEDFGDVTDADYDSNQLYSASSRPYDTDDDFEMLFQTYDVEIHGRPTILPLSRREPSIPHASLTSSPLSLPQEPNPRSATPMLQFEQVYGSQVETPSEEKLRRHCRETEGFIKKHLHQARTPQYLQLAYLLKALRHDFACLPETRALYGIQIQVRDHYEDAVDYTRRVVAALLEHPRYTELSSGDKVIVEVATHLHAIGQGEQHDEATLALVSQPPAFKALGRVQRILTEDIADLKSRSARLVPRLVAYHDLLGGIITGQRRIDELVRAAASMEMLNLLILIGSVTLEATDRAWGQSHAAAVEYIRGRVAAKL